jgi:gamma-glutamyltranspeptidase
MPIRSFIAMLLLTPLTLAQETAPPLFAADTPIIDYQNPQLPGYGRIGMVVSPEKLAGDIGLDMLKQGR